MVCTGQGAAWDSMPGLGRERRTQVLRSIPLLAYLPPPSVVLLAPSGLGGCCAHLFT